MLRLVNKYNLRQQGCFVLDTYPISSELQLVTVSQDVAAQVTQQRQTFPKHPAFHRSAKLIGKRGLVLLEGLVLHPHTSAYVKSTYRLINYPFQPILVGLPLLDSWYVDITSASLYG